MAKGLAHPGLEWLRESQEGSAWLERLPLLLRECTDQWSLRVGEPYPYASASLAVPATLPDGAGAVLKMQFPDRESEFEAATLVRWDGDGAVRLLAHDAGRHALLLERCDPGTPLSELEQDDALDVMVALLPRLWKPVGGPLRSLVDEAAWWAGYLPATWERSGHPFERGLLEAVLDALEVLPRSQGEQVLVNQDLHADNVLRARREPWLVIGPKAARRRTRVRSGRDRPGGRAGWGADQRSPSPQSADGRARAGPGQNSSLGDGADPSLGGRGR